MTFLCQTSGPNAMSLQLKIVLNTTLEHRRLYVLAMVNMMFYLKPPIC